jgi:hypothetical protein
MLKILSFLNYGLGILVEAAESMLNSNYRNTSIAVPSERLLSHNEQAHSDISPRGVCLSSDWDRHSKYSSQDYNNHYANGC